MHFKMPKHVFKKYNFFFIPPVIIFKFFIKYTYAEIIWKEKLVLQSFFMSEKICEKMDDVRENQRFCSKFFYIVYKNNFKYCIIQQNHTYSMNKYIIS